MATTVSFQDIEKTLSKFRSSYSKSDVPYIILSAFGKHDADIRRWKEGKGVIASFNGLLIKGLLAYRECKQERFDSVLYEMKNDPIVRKAGAKILAVSDGVRILAFDPMEQETYEQSLDKMWVDFQFFYPLCGVTRYRGIEENPADVRAAEKMAKLHDEIRAYNDYSSEDDLHDLNIFMSRLLFCFFAEDTGIFTDNLFTASIERYTKEDGSDLSDYIEEAFLLMDSRISQRKDVSDIFRQFPYVNGSLFSQRIHIPQMGRKARRVLIECGQLSWKDINPDIFGSMIQAVVTPSERANLGMHYTSVPNIMKVIQPLFLDELYEEYAKNKDNIKNLTKLLNRMAQMRFFDPACGSGNFLIIAYKELRKLEIQIWKRLRELGHATIPFPNIQIDQFYGIELDDFACEVAELSLRLAEHQMNCHFTREFTDVHIEALPLKKMEHIVKGNACRIDWNSVCPHGAEDEVFIMGNPPYQGARLQEPCQKEDMTHVFKGANGCNNLDYISAWFYLGAQYIRESKARLALVSTNSICQGEQVPLLWKKIIPLAYIQFAYHSFKWSNNAKNKAIVSCIIVGLSANNEQRNCYIFSENQKKKVEYINPYLNTGSNIIVEGKTKSPNGIPDIVFGSMPNDGGHLLLEPDEKRELELQDVRSQHFIHKFCGAEEFINSQERYCLWIEPNEQNEAMQIGPIKKRIEACRIKRLASKRESTRKLAKVPYRFGEVRYSNEPKIIIPSVSSEKRKYVPIGYLDADTVISNSAFAIFGAPRWLFGFVTSYLHMIWLQKIGGKLENRYRYSAQVVYNTFPFPTITPAKRQEIEAAAEEVLLCREDYPGKTLAELYDPDTMPEPLKEAHHKLDLIVESCYQAEPFTNDEERLECLFKLYEKMTRKK